MPVIYPPRNAGVVSLLSILSRRMEEIERGIEAGCNLLYSVELGIMRKCSVRIFRRPCIHSNMAKRRKKPSAFGRAMAYFQCQTAKRRYVPAFWTLYTEGIY